MGALANWLKDHSDDPAAAEKVVASRAKAKAAKPLGKGTFGTAFDIGGKKVLKLTADKTEANAMAVVQAKPSPYIVKVYDVFQLGKKHVKGNDVYGIVQDKLSPPDAGFANFIAQIRPAILYKKPGYLTLKAFVQFYKTLQKEREDDPSYLSDFTNQRLEWLAAVAKYFDDTGIKFHDFHKGNVMKKGSKHVMIDLGASKSPAAKIPVQESYESEEFEHALKAYYANPCAGTRYALEMARAAVELEISEVVREDRLSFAEQLIETMADSVMGKPHIMYEHTLHLPEEYQLIQIIWKRLPSRLRNRIDMKKLKSFIEYLEDGDNLAGAAKSARIQQALAVDLMAQIERMGLL